MLTVLVYWWAIYGWKVKFSRDFVAFLSCLELFIELVILILVLSGSYCENSTNVLD
jgi:NADH:ubiquinone oxidoreductase subunit K